GYTIEPVEVEYTYDTLFGKKVTFPFYFQNPVFCSLDRIEKVLGMPLNAKECVAAMEKMGCRAEKQLGTERSDTEEKTGILVYPAEYRNDFLHAADVAEDVMIGRNLSSFAPLTPQDFTIGRLTPITLFSRKVKEIMIGLGYQEMIFNYLGSRKNLVENMRGDGNRILQISNPMTENFEYVRDSILASLMMSESVSGHSVYPHKVFEIGKVAYKDESENYGTQTHQYLGFVEASADTNFNTIASQIQTLFYYLSREYTLETSADSRFIPGRAATILYNNEKVGVFGEIHPEVLENWGVAIPCTALEIDLEMVID
ncbi:MAG: phenylalanine--tRNA ligase subunit beta, partial [Treponema sp.]|nr:phenylalanine--tRNA ligase subunit beta [Treponema sp.]